MICTAPWPSLRTDSSPSRSVRDVPSTRVLCECVSENKGAQFWGSTCLCVARTRSPTPATRSAVSQARGKRCVLLAEWWVHSSQSPRGVVFVRAWAFHFSDR